MEPDKKIKTDEAVVDIRETLPGPKVTKEEKVREIIKERMANQDYLVPQPTEAEREIQENIRIERQRILTAGTANTRDYATIQFTPKQVSYLIGLLSSQPNLHALSVIEECLVKLESARIRI
jgi:hypothetical protein